MKDSTVLVHLIRGPLLESLHRGHAAVVDNEGRLLYSAGNPDTVTFARSSAKPLQALPVLESGAARRFGITPKEIALLCASHNGEEEHIDTAAGLLAKLGLGEEALQCGPHDPFRPAAARKLAEQGRKPSRLHNNCSGKHSGMLALSLQLGAPVDTYMETDHPVQRLMLETVASMSGTATDRIPLGTDGCGVPVFGLALTSLARAFARLGKPDGLADARRDACLQVLDALRSHPFQLAGTDRYDTRLIEVTGGRIIGKMGAEGVFALTVPEHGIGLALKVEDGAARALYPAVTEALKQADLLRPAELEALASFHKPDVTNWAGRVVGRIEPVLQLQKA
ncbi:asparaginase [Paenibacillus sp. J31TS4]|uniref:asparaginase n=1 Tax=Paenibacillus sp. J31TS4 TaxID=2807195 RepID=UPI001B027575|nr:asparaginase [Paenibacillus sp. J31TS4]GIP39796.1 asparaginase [Paenibacillus sp. J31TS4]